MSDDQVSPAEEHRRDDLATAARELKDEVAELREAVETLTPRTVRAEFVARVGIALALALVLGGAVLGWNIIQQRHTSDRLESVTQSALCPVFGLLLGGYDPNTRPEGPARDQYMQTFEVMRGAHEALACRGPLVPKREDG